MPVRRVVCGKVEGCKVWSDGVCGKVLFVGRTVRQLRVRVCNKTSPRRCAPLSPNSKLPLRTPFYGRAQQKDHSLPLVPVMRSIIRLKRSEYALGSTTDIPFALEPHRHHKATFTSRSSLLANVHSWNISMMPM